MNKGKVVGTCQYWLLSTDLAAQSQPLCIGTTKAAVSWNTGWLASSQLHQLLTFTARSPRAKTTDKQRRSELEMPLLKKGRTSVIGMLMIWPNDFCALLENLKVRKYGKEQHTCNKALCLFFLLIFMLWTKDNNTKHMLGTKAFMYFSLLGSNVLVYSAYAWNKVLSLSFSFRFIFQIKNVAYWRIKP